MLPPRPYTYEEIVAAVREKRVTRELIKTVFDMPRYPDFASKGYATITTVNALVGTNTALELDEINEMLYDILMTCERIEAAEETPV